MTRLLIQHHGGRAHRAVAQLLLLAVISEPLDHPVQLGDGGSRLVDVIDEVVPVAGQHIVDRSRQADDLSRQADGAARQSSVFMEQGTVRAQ